MARGNPRIGRRIRGHQGSTKGVVTGDSGKHDTDASLRSEIVSDSRSRGLFAGVDLSGAVVRRDPDATRTFYGHDEAVAVLLERLARTPSAADAFLSRVRAAF